MAIDSGYSAPYSRQLRVDITTSLDRLQNMLSETIQTKEKARVAKEMAQEVAIMNLMTQEFATNRQEMFDTRKVMLQKGIKLPAMDRTAGFDDFIALIDDVNSATVADMIDEIGNQEEKILNMYEADIAYTEGLKSRRGMELAAGMITDEYFGGDADSYEDFMLVGGIEELGEDVFGFTPGSELALAMPGMEPGEFEDLQQNEFFRQGFEQGAMTAGEAIAFQQEKDKLYAANRALQAGDFDLTSKILNKSETDIGTIIAPGLNIGFGREKVNPTFLFGAAGEGKADEAFARIMANIDAKSGASIGEGGAPNLTSALVSVVQQIRGGGPNAYDGLVAEVANTFEVIRDYTNLIMQYARSRGINREEAEKELLAPVDQASRALQDNPDWININEQVKSLYSERQERINVGFYTNMDNMRQAYDLKIVKTNLQDAELNFIFSRTGKTAKDVMNQYSRDASTIDPNSEQYKIMMEEALDFLVIDDGTFDDLSGRADINEKIAADADDISYWFAPEDPGSELLGATVLEDEIDLGGGMMLKIDASIEGATDEEITEAYQMIVAQRNLQAVKIPDYLRKEILDLATRTVQTEKIRLAKRNLEKQKSEYRRSKYFQGVRN
jgi:hypothetical protein